MCLRALQTPPRCEAARRRFLYRRTDPWRGRWAPPSQPPLSRSAGRQLAPRRGCAARHPQQCGGRAARKM